MSTVILVNPPMPTSNFCTSFSLIAVNGTAVSVRSVSLGTLATKLPAKYNVATPLPSLVQVATA